jgi:hypothetical protein
MGNICTPSKGNNDSKEDKEMNATSKQGVTILTFAGPQDCFDSFQEEHPPTFSDPLFFTQNKSMDMKSMPKDQLVAN